VVALAQSSHSRGGDRRQAAACVEHAACCLTDAVRVKCSGRERGMRHMGDAEDLERFVVAQEADGAYSRALGELRSGRKTGHWMWFIFPQLAGLGRSDLSRLYSIATLSEARAYLDHPILGPRLIECTRVVSEVRGRTATEIFGAVDAMKLHSSMTLFMRAQAEEPIFAAIIERYFDGEPDAPTEALLGADR
jgi:uncharacterized protein (DUF1810 family)